MEWFNLHFASMSAEVSSIALLDITAISHGCTAKSKRFIAVAK